MSNFCFWLWNVRSSQSEDAANSTLSLMELYQPHLAILIETNNLTKYNPIITKYPSTIYTPNTPKGQGIAIVPLDPDLTITNPAFSPDQRIISFNITRHTTTYKVGALYVPPQRQDRTPWLNESLLPSLHIIDNCDIIMGDFNMTP
ncbi:hypothetical protein SAMD00019534_126520, partial [Acytostelium subglobosum LB1]|uniref:hypothetical protein n=1 Tax=Acytostelium subglobosum LB1 TaxID=1410327 RepID=UPI00064504F0